MAGGSVCRAGGVPAGAEAGRDDGADVAGRLAGAGAAGREAGAVSAGLDGRVDGMNLAAGILVSVTADSAYLPLRR
jgi:hypothetical protein